MARTALSARNKQQVKSKTKQADFQLAMASFYEHLAADPDASDAEKTKWIGLIAQEHEVNRNTLKSYVTDPDHRSIWDFNRTKAKVPIALERDYVQFLQESHDRGLGRDKDQIRDDVNELLTSLPEHERKEPVTDAWVNRFLDRYRDELRTYWGSSLASERAKALNPTNIRLFYELIHRVVVVPKIAPECIWGMDETNTQDVEVVRRKVVGRVGRKHVHRQGGGSKASTTVIAAIGADRTALRPTVIFKGKNIQISWTKNNVSNASLAYSHNGWIDSEIGYRWLTEHFEPQTREAAAGRTCALLLDNHSSHWSTKFLRAAKEKDIEVVGYPPHSTHALQGLDVVAFGRLKDMLAKACAALAALGTKLSKDNFLEVFGNVWLKSMDPELVKAAFEKTGIVPYNPNVISQAQMKPSEATSITANSAAPIASPVKAVVDALSWGLPNLTDADLDLDSLPEPPVPTHAQRPITGTSHSLDKQHPDATRIHAIDPDLLRISPQLIPSPNSTPSRRHKQRSDGSPDSPRKHVRILASGLAQTSASFLISKAPMKSSDQLASPINEPVHADRTLEPDWRPLTYRNHTVDDLMDLPKEQLAQLARRGISSLETAKASLANTQETLQHSNSRIVLQRLENTAQRKALAYKEQKAIEKLTKHGVLCPDGAPMLLTSPEVLDALQAIEDEEKASKVEKDQRKRDAAEKAALDASRTRYWDAVKAQVQREREEWDTKFKELRDQGETINGAKRLLEARPTLPLKATVFAEHDAKHRPIDQPPIEDVDDEAGVEGDWQGFGSMPYGEVNGGGNTGELRQDVGEGEGEGKDDEEDEEDDEDDEDL